MLFKACGAFLVLGNARAGRPPGRGLVASGRIENPAEASDGLKPGVFAPYGGLRFT